MKKNIFLDFNLNVFIYAFIALKYSLYIINNAKILQKYIILVDIRIKTNYINF